AASRPPLLIACAARKSAAATTCFGTSPTGTGRRSRDPPSRRSRRFGSLGYEGDLPLHVRQRPSTKPKRNLNFAGSLFGARWGVGDSSRKEVGESSLHSAGLAPPTHPTPARHRFSDLMSPC